MGTHAIRRNAYSGIAWGFIHFPMHATLIAVGASMSKIVSSFHLYPDYIPSASLRLVFCVGCGLTIAFFTVINSLHSAHSHDCQVGPGKRALVRMLCALGIALLGGFGVSFGPLALMGIVVAILLPLVCFEEWARLSILKRQVHGHVCG